jgi:hypothetical protein
MNRSATTTTFTLVCVAVLLASYGIGLGIREIRFRNAKAQNKVNKAVVPANTSQQRQPTSVARPRQAGRPDATFLGEGNNEAQIQDEGMGRRGRFNENMSDEERAQMRERFGGRRGRRGMDLENLSEEERAAWEEQMRDRMERFQNMTDEERAQFQGGRGGRSRSRMSDFGAGQNDYGLEGDNLQADDIDAQSQDDNLGYQEDESQSENDELDQEEVDNDIE